MGACVMLTTLLFAGCAQSMQSADTGSAPQAIQVMIENQTGTTMEVHVARIGSPGWRLGRVAPSSRNTFRLPLEMTGSEATLYSVSSSAPGPFGRYVSTPFQTLGVREVRWVISNGLRLSAVTVR
jgi:hypothetical protein